MGAKIKAAIDIGSNTVLLLIGKPKNGRVEVIREEQAAPRLGNGVDAQNNLNAPSMRRAIKALNRYKTIIKEYGLQVYDVAVVATSAVRDAGNKQEFIDQIKQETGFIVTILSGDEEARFTFLGAQSVLKKRSGRIAVIDVGGGSTEVAVGKGARLTDRYSFNIGSVRFTERYLKNSPPTETELTSCRQAIAEALEKRSFEFSSEVSLVGVAGTVTSAAAITTGIKTYHADKINGIKLDRESLSSLIADFSNCTSKMLLDKYPKLLKGRADVILAGLLILEGFMNTYAIPHLIASTGGIRHGALLKTHIS